MMRPESWCTPNHGVPPNRGAGLLARTGEHLRAVRTIGNPNRQGGIAVHGSSPIRALCVIRTAE